MTETLRKEIEALPQGSPISSQRSLVLRFGVSATTVSDALSALAHEGLVTARPGAGTVRAVTPRAQAVGDYSWQEMALAQPADQGNLLADLRSFDASALVGTFSPFNPEVIDLNGGYLHPDLQPRELLSRALARVARRTESWERPPPGGIPELRDWFASEIGGGLGRHEVMVCGAGQEALSSVLRALVPPGEAVALESPCYPGAAAAARAGALRTVPVGLDEQGMRPDELDRALATTRAKAVVIQPLFQNPTGASCGVQRGLQLLEVARSHQAFVVEDDFARYLAHHDAPPLPPPLAAQDPNGVVVHIRSLTKPTSPSLRVGAVAARGPVLGRLRSALTIDAMMVSAPLQYTALEVVSASGWRRALAQLGRVLGHRRQAAVEAVATTFGAGAMNIIPHGGYHLWVSLREGTEATGFAAGALSQGVCVTPGDNYYVSDVAGPHVRISYIATPSVIDLEAGLERLRMVETLS